MPSEQLNIPADTSSELKDAPIPPEETKPVEAKPDESKPVERKPDESKEPEAKPDVDTKTANEEGDQPPVRVIPEIDKYVLPDGTPQRVAEFANKNDMTQEQLDSSLAEFGLYMSEADQQARKLMRDNGEAHVKSWGKQSKTNLSLCKRALQVNDPEGTLTKVLDDSGYGNHPVVLDFLLNLGTQLKEGGFLKGSTNVPAGKQSAAQIMFGKSHPSKDN